MAAKRASRALDLVVGGAGESLRAMRYSLRSKACSQLSRALDPLVYDELMRSTRDVFGARASHPVFHPFAAYLNRIERS